MSVCTNEDSLVCVPAQLCPCYLLAITHYGKSMLLVQTGELPNPARNALEELMLCPDGQFSRALLLVKNNFHVFNLLAHRSNGNTFF